MTTLPPVWVVEALLVWAVVLSEVPWEVPWEAVVVELPWEEEEACGAVVVEVYVHQWVVGEEGVEEEAPSVPTWRKHSP